MKYITLKNEIILNVIETEDFDECCVVPEDFSHKNVGKKRYEFDSNWNLISHMDDIETIKQINDIMTQLIYLDGFVPRYFETSLQHIPEAMNEEVFPGVTRGDLLKEKLDLRAKLKLLSKA